MTLHSEFCQETHRWEARRYQCPGRRDPAALQSCREAWPVVPGRLLGKGWTWGPASRWEGSGRCPWRRGASSTRAACSGPSPREGLGISRTHLGTVAARGKCQPKGPGGTRVQSVTQGRQANGAAGGNLSVPTADHQDGRGREDAGAAHSPTAVASPPQLRAWGSGSGMPIPRLRNADAAAHTL